MITRRQFNTITHHFFSGCRGAEVLRNLGPISDSWDNIQLVSFVVNIAYSMFVSVAPFGVLVLNHSDVLRDPAFRSKATFAGVHAVILFNCVSFKPET